MPLVCWDPRWLAVSPAGPSTPGLPGPPAAEARRRQGAQVPPEAPTGGAGPRSLRGRGSPRPSRGCHPTVCCHWAGFAGLATPRHQTGNPLGSVMPRVGPLGGPVPLPSLKAPRRSLRKVEHSSRLRWQQLPPPTPETSPHPRLLPRPGWPSSSPTVAAGPAWGPVPAAQGSRGPSPRAPGALGPPQVLPWHLPSRTWSCVSPRSPPTVTSWSFPSLGSSACMQWPRAPRPGDPPPA